MPLQARTESKLKHLLLSQVLSFFDHENESSQVEQTDRKEGREEGEEEREGVKEGRTEGQRDGGWKIGKLNLY